MGTLCKDLWSWCKDFLARCRDFLCEPVSKKNLFNWDTVDKNEKEEKKLLSFLREDLTFLFRISSNFENHFKNTETSVDLRKSFNVNGHPLSNNAKILTVANKNEWKIEDMGKVYKIKKPKFCKKLNIYGPNWTVDPDIRKTPDGKTIRIFKGENLPKIDLYEGEEKATLKIGDGRTLDLTAKREDGKLNLYYVEFPHSRWWRVLVTIVFVIIGDVLSKTGLMELFIVKPCNLCAPLAIYSLWGLILYLSLILWLPTHNIWGCIERVNYAEMRAGQLRQKISGNLNTVSTLVAFSIAFIVLSMSIFFTNPLEGNKLTVFKLVMGFLVTGAIFLVITLEAYDSCLNPAFNSAQIARLYTKGWWLYTFGIYSIVVALLLYIYLLEPWITIMGVILFMVTFSIYLKTECNIKPKCNQSIKRRIDK